MYLVATPWNNDIFCALFFHDKKEKPIKINNNDNKGKKEKRKYLYYLMRGKFRTLGVIICTKPETPWSHVDYHCHFSSKARHAVFDANWFYAVRSQKEFMATIQ